MLREETVRSKVDLAAKVAELQVRGKGAPQGRVVSGK